MNILRRASTRQLLIAIDRRDRDRGRKRRRVRGRQRPQAAAAARWPRRIHQAAPAKPVQGVTARVQFTDHLIPSGSLGSGSPLITGATGRVWAGNGKLRLELQSSAGDTEIVFDGSRVTVYDVAKGTAYTLVVPQHRHARRERPRPPRGAERRRDPQGLAKLSQHVDLSGAIAGDIAGQPSYTVRVSPRHSGGLLGIGASWPGTPPTACRCGSPSTAAPTPRRCSR